MKHGDQWLKRGELFCPFKCLQCVGPCSRRWDTMMTGKHGLHPHTLQRSPFQLVAGPARNLESALTCPSFSLQISEKICWLYLPNLSRLHHVHSTQFHCPNSDLSSMETVQHEVSLTLSSIFRKITGVIRLQYKPGFCYKAQRCPEKKVQAA